MKASTEAVAAFKLAAHGPPQLENEIASKARNF